ncbi:MAG: manganese efflux pump MntP family protein [Spirochaetia bacterium]|nr:manganese efflux pump MntP family protein [Spirochaetia bacterium]
MSIHTIFFIALSLSMDAFAVSVSSGAAAPKLRFDHALRAAGLFGIFQALMPLLGWALGQSAAHLVTSIDHWIAFILLAGIGGKMLYEGINPDREESSSTKDPFDIKLLLMLAVATSIDAAAVGISFSCLCIDITLPLVIIGVTTFFISLAGVYLGRQGNRMIGTKAEILGGVALISIGGKILIEHLY